MIDHALRTAGATRNLLSEPAAELLFRACRGLPRLASKLLHASLIVAHSRDQAFLDDAVVAAAIADLSHELPTNPDPLKPRTQTGTRITEVIRAVTLGGLGQRGGVRMHREELRLRSVPRETRPSHDHEET